MARNSSRGRKGKSNRVGMNPDVPMICALWAMIGGCALLLCGVDRLTILKFITTTLPWIVGGFLLLYSISVLVPDIYKTNDVGLFRRIERNFLNPFGWIFPLFQKNDD